MIQNEIEILPLTQFDLDSIDNLSVKSGKKIYYSIISVLLSIFCFLITRFNLFNEIDGQSETIASIAVFFFIILLLGFRTLWSNLKRFKKFSSSTKKYCGTSKIIDKRQGDDEYEIYFEINPTVFLPVYFIKKNIYDKINIGDNVSFEYVNELKLFIKLDWKKEDLR